MQKQFLLQIKQGFRGLKNRVLTHEAGRVVRVKYFPGISSCYNSVYAEFLYRCCQRYTSSYTVKNGTLGTLLLKCKNTCFQSKQSWTNGSHLLGRVGQINEIACKGETEHVQQITLNVSRFFSYNLSQFIITTAELSTSMSSLSSQLKFDCKNCFCHFKALAIVRKCLKLYEHGYTELLFGDFSPMTHFS